MKTTDRIQLAVDYIETDIVLLQFKLATHKSKITLIYDNPQNYNCLNAKYHHKQVEMLTIKIKELNNLILTIKGDLK